LAEFFDIEAGYPRLWIFDAASGTRRPLINEINGGAVWCADDGPLAYAGVGAGQMPRVYLRHGIGPGEGRGLFPEYRPDQLQVPSDCFGELVLFQSQLSGDVWAGDAGGNKEPTPLLDDPGAAERSAMLSPDGHWIAFISDESGRPQAYLQRFEAGWPPRVFNEPCRVSTNGALSLRWHPAGGELF
jgi:hypothetical protein